LKKKIALSNKNTSSCYTQSYKYKKSSIVLANICALFYSILSILTLIILIRLISIRGVITLFTILVSCSLLSLFLFKTYNSPYIKTDYKYINIALKGFKYKSFSISESTFVMDGDLIKITSKDYEHGRISLSLLNKSDRLDFVKLLKI
jgi:hypothetical protein